MTLCLTAFLSTDRRTFETAYADVPRLAHAILCGTDRRCDADVAIAGWPGQHAGGGTTEQQKPNILFIMGDDIGWMQPSIYHRGLMVGETPNIDRIGNEGAMFMTYYAEQSCTAGRNAFFTGMHPLRTGMIPPQLPGSPSWLRPGTPAVAKFLLDLGYNTGEFGKNHLGDHTEALPTAHGFQEFWGYLYHLDAMQGVSFPDINKTPTDAGHRAAVHQHADPGSCPRFPARWIRERRLA